MAGPIKILAKCPTCNNSLMNFKFQVDDLPAIDLQAKVGDKLGHVYLSQIYGSFNKAFDNVDNIDGSIAEFSCPHCHSPFSVKEICDCNAPIISLALKIGGLIKFCTRNGCKKHSLEFEDAESVFRLFKTQDETFLA